MQIRRTHLHYLLIERFLPLVALAVLLIYSYARFTQIPYLGFFFNPSSGEVDLVYVQKAPGVSIQKGDRIIQVGSVVRSDYLASLTLPLFEKMKVGDEIQILVQRGDEKLIIPWVISSPTSQEISDRFINVWILAYVFWFCGIAVLLIVRPKDIQWRLLLIFFFITSIWLITGSISSWRVWKSAFVFRTAIWLCVPIYLHLHWSLPVPLAKAHSSILWIGYLIGIALAVGEWLQLLPINSYFIGFVLAFIGSLILLGLHILLQPDQRRELRFLVLGSILAFIPPLGISIVRLFVHYPQWAGGALLGIPALPIAYFYTLAQRKLGPLELRTNRAISAYIFLVLLGTLSIFLHPLVATAYNIQGAPLIINASIAVLSGIFALIAYPRFERFMDRRLFGIKLLPAQLVEEFSSRISTCLTVSSIIRLLKEELLNSLLVRQSALLRLEEGSRISTVYAEGVEFAELPGEADVDAMRAQAKGYRQPFSDGGNPPLFPWARLILSLQVGDKAVGFWLLGRRDPDDFYAQAEITVLQTIANHTATALVNISQSEQLQAIHLANVERYEEERLNLAGDLHDEVLNQLAVLSMNVDRNTSPAFEEHYQLITEQLRHVIGDLRPAMLIFGLQPALEELVNEIAERKVKDVKVSLELPPSNFRYPPMIENHLYRIVQQAVENALRHSGCKTIRIYGELEPERTQVIVEDDGKGFAEQGRLDLEQFLSQRHFGLVRMFERASIVDADLRIDSKPGQGTKVIVVWQSRNDAVE